MASTDKVILYSYFRSSCSYRVRIALALKQIDYEYRAVHLVRNGGEQHGEDFKSLNPMGEVPYFVHGENHLSQSMAIIEYMDRIWPVPRLFPVGAWEGSVVRQLCEAVNTGIQPIQNLKVLKEIEQRFAVDQKGKAHWAQNWIDRGFSGLERQLEKTSGDFCYGEQPTAADCFLIPQVYNARRFSVDLDKYPTIAKIDANCVQLEAFKLAHPANQPDTST